MPKSRYVDGKQLSYWDTVEVELDTSRALVGRKFSFFTDLSNKQPRFCNLTQSRRIPSHVRMTADKLRVEYAHWSGDTFVEGFLRKHARLTLYVGPDRKFERPLSQVGSYQSEGMFDAPLDNNDDFRVEITIDDVPWKAPELQVLVEKFTTEWESVRWPLWLTKAAARLQLPLPDLARQKSGWEWQTRPLKGSTLVTVYLEGEGEESVR